MHPTDDERVKSVRKGLGYAEADAAAHGVAHVVRSVNVLGIQHGDDIGSHQLSVVSVGVMELVAVAMTASID